MSARDTMKRNKTAIQTALSGDYRLILNKVQENNLITTREYNNLKSINKQDVEGHVVELVDKIMNKGEDTCEAFLDLLQTDEVQATYPELRNIHLNDTMLLPTPVQVSSVHSDLLPQESKRRKMDDLYQLNSKPVGLCVIINNESFMDGTLRSGTDKDAQSLAEVFSWLGFRVLMVKDQTKDQMDRVLACFASLSDLAQLQEFGAQEWSGSRFTDPQQDVKHGDAFICCVLTHGRKGVVLGTDLNPLPIKQITTMFKATEQSALSGKPKVFLIQACQGSQKQHGVFVHDLEADEPLSSFIPEDADLLVAVATVEDHAAFRHKVEGSWFVQTVCEQLKERCPRGEDVTTILHHVNYGVGLREASTQHGAGKQIPEVRFTLRKRLVLSPHHE
ncbi:caspase-8-like [Embiotoca jacksoni]|uniref:caspase-8-like n=1 Tax=Embiotoca jacksoni TaxID=100190 RepID=UPI003703D508